MGRGTGRSGTAPKKRGGKFFVVLITVGLIVTIASRAAMILDNLEENLALVGLERGISLELFLLWLSSGMMAMTDLELAKPEWDLEWLVTLPVRLPVLLATRIISRIATNQAMLIVLPFLAAMAWRSGHHLGMPLYLVFVGLPLILILCSFQTILDTGLKIRFPPGSLRNLQAVASIVGIILLFMSISTDRGEVVISRLLGALPAAAWDWTPFLLATRVMRAPDWQSGLPTALLFWAEALVIFAGSVALIARLLANGIVAHSGRELGRNRAAAPLVAAGSHGSLRSWLTPMQRKELLLLKRDRNFFVQTLVLPLVLVFGQAFFGSAPGVDRSFFFGREPREIAALIFWFSSYSLMTASVQVLAAEGKSLWILFCVPKRLDELLWEKARLWGAISLIYPALLLAVFFGMGGRSSLALATYIGVSLLALPAYTVIAISLGIFGADPFGESNRRVRLRFVYLYMILVSFFAVALFAGSARVILVLGVLTLSLAYALWQKARDLLPYLLDPSLNPEARVSLADGLMAVMILFILQFVFAIFTRKHGALESRLFFSFSLAGLSTFLIFRFSFFRSRAQGIPRYFGKNWRRSLGLGIPAGIAASLVGLAYEVWVYHRHWVPALPSNGLNLNEHSPWIVGMVVLAAPLCEEFIFRGLVMGGLRRSQNFTLSLLLSSALFALVHPPLSAPVVFLMALIAGSCFELTQTLFASVVVHAVYNLSLIFLTPKLLAWIPPS